MVVLWLLATPALAKKRKIQIGAPEVDSAMTLMATCYALVGVIGVCVVGFKNSRRTHLD